MDTTKDSTRSLKDCAPDLSVVKMLAAIPFPSFDKPTCGHEKATATRFTVTASSTECVCQDCFDSLLPKIRAAKEAPRFRATCFLCAMDTEVWFDPNLEMNVCRDCWDANEKAMRDFESKYTPAPNVIPEEVSPNCLFIGPKDAAYTKAVLKDLKITRILICCEVLPAYHRDDPSIRYHRIPLRDSLSQELLEFLPSALAFIAQGYLVGPRDTACYYYIWK